MALMAAFQPAKQIPQLCWVTLSPSEELCLSLVDRRNATTKTSKMEILLPAGKSGHIVLLGSHIIHSIYIFPKIWRNIGFYWLFWYLNFQVEYTEQVYSLFCLEISEGSVAETPRDLFSSFPNMATLQMHLWCMKCVWNRQYLPTKKAQNAREPPVNAF